MNIVRLVPEAPLDAVVAMLWWSRRAEPYMCCEHLLPSGSTQLVIALHEQPIGWANAGCDRWHRWTGSIVHGPQSTYYRAGPKPAGTIMGVAFRPGAAGALLGVPATELLDRHVSLEDLWGNGARELQERLALSPDANSALRLLAHALRTRLKPLLIHPAIAHALRANYAQPIDLLREQTGYSHRHFIALFRATTGLAPKHFFRIRRFSEAVHLLAQQQASLVDLAARMNYADQAHFTREFRELCGVPPTAYRATTPDSPHHHVA